MFGRYRKIMTAKYMAVQALRAAGLHEDADFLSQMEYRDAIIWFETLELTTRQPVGALPERKK